MRKQSPNFLFMAEVYWDLEWTLQQQGFDYTYDKRLYDRLREGHARPVRDHLRADPDYQCKMARFLENHDEPRAAATFSPGMHEAAAVITFLSQGLRFFHQGQFEGRRKRISPHLVRAPLETSDNSPPSRFMMISSGCSGGRLFETASGNYSNVSRPGKATGPRIASWLLRGKDSTSRTAARSSELRQPPESVSIPPAFFRSHGPHGAIPRPHVLRLL